MKILSASQIKIVDRKTILKEPISSIDLMERAAKAFLNWFVKRFDSSRAITIFCGVGNNGGDGLAIARLLEAYGYQVAVIVLRYGAEPTSDFEQNLERLERVEHVNIVNADSIESASRTFMESDIVIDAILGMGLNKPIEGLVKSVVALLNECPALKVAVDSPTGLFPDKSTTSLALDADHTVSFQFPKLAFMFPQNAQYIGNGHVVNIHLHAQAIGEAQTATFYTTERSVVPILKKREKFAHKGTFGHGLVVAGSYGKMGAAVLSSFAALKSGAGLVTAHIPGCGYTIMQSTIPEIMVETAPQNHLISGIPLNHPYKAIGIGPGIGTDDQTARGLKKLLKQSKSPLVIDADAINIIAEHPNLIKLVPKNSIITPHIKEFQRLVGTWENDFECHEMQRTFAMKFQLIVVLKGAHTCVMLPNGEAHFNSVWSTALSTAGSGDVLTGFLTGLLTQGYSPDEAAILGVYIHAFAGYLAGKEMEPECVIARDIIDYLSDAIKHLRQVK